MHASAELYGALTILFIRCWTTAAQSGRSCGKTSFTDQSGIIDLPRTLPSGMMCNYSITTDLNNSVSIKFLKFKLLYSNFDGSCTTNWLKIICPSDNSTVESPWANKKFCGSINWSSSLRISRCKTVILQLVTSNYHWRPIVYEVQIQYNTSASDDENDHLTVDCGETVFNDSTGIISLPYNPTGYLARINCTYALSPNRSSVFWFDVSSLNLTEIAKSFLPFLSCGSGSFLIQCISEYWTLGGRNYFSLCQQMSGLSQTLMFSSCREAIISIRSEYFSFQETYQIPFKVVTIDDICGTTSLSASDGVITSPGFPLRYPRGVNCTYSIPAGNDSSVSLHFSTFEIVSSGSSDPCYNDWLMITCSEPAEVNTYAGRRFCGELIWPTFIRFFNCSILQLTFVSSRTSEDSYYGRSQLNRRGFSVSYTRETDNFVNDLPEFDCGQTFIPSTSGEIHIPYNRSIPLAKINCTFTISANINNSEFIFNHRLWNNYLGSSKDCSRHQLTVTCVTKNSSNSTKSRSYCGGSDQMFSNEYLRLSCDEVELFLHAIIYHRNQWMRIPFLVLDCGTTSFFGPSGLITSQSPLRPTGYNPFIINLRSVPCIYTIDIGENKTVSLNFLEFGLEGHSWSSDRDSCYSEWLIIRCIGLSNETSTANFFANRQLCGRKRLQTTFAGCIKMMFETVRNFRDDGSSRRIGFIIEYTTHEYSDHCGNTSFADLTGVITSPGYPKPYPHGLNCTYSISVGTNSVIALEFTLFDLFADCNQDWLSISCHPNETMDVKQIKTKKLCVVKKVPFQIMLTSCLYLTLNFVTNSLSSKMGFRTLFEIKTGYEDSCGGKVFTNPTGIISSPDYPLSYPRGLNCTYTISVGLNSTMISLEFLFFDLYGSTSLTDPWSDECSHDWLVLSCPSNETEVTDRYANRKLCGLKEVPFATVFSRCPNVTITFTADSFVTKGGFLIEYKVKTTDKESCDDAPNSGYMLLSKSCSYVIPIGQGNKTSIGLRWSYWPSWSRLTSKDCDLYWVIFTLANCESAEMADAFRYANRKLCNSNLDSSSFPYINIVFSNCQYVTLFFFSADNSIYGNSEAVGYRISRSDDRCGNTSFTSPVGVISSADNRGYEYAMCTYTVDTGNSGSVLVTFLAFSVGQISGRLTPNFENYTCPNSWMTIRCSSDGYTIMHPSLGKKLCGNIAPQPILFRNCSILKLNFAITDSNHFYSWLPFRVHYLSIEQICGKELFFDSSGIISFRNYETSFNCSYSIVADDLSTLSLTVSSVANSTTTNTTCQEDWILVACIDGQMKYENKLSYKDCIVTNLRTQLVIFGCKTITIVFHSENNRSRAQYLVTYNVIKSHESVSPGQTTLTTFTESLDFHRFTSIRDFAEYRLLVSLTVILAVTIILLLSFLWLRRRSQTTGNSLVPKEADEFGDGTSSMSGSVTKPRGSGPTFGKLRRLRSHFHAETSYLPLKSMNSTDQEASASVETFPPQKTDSCGDLQRGFMAEPSHSDKL